MNIRRCLRIAERLRLPFEQQVGIAIDPQRMLSDPAYASDVLTVCEARPDSPLAAWARQFRLAAAEDMPGADAGALGPAGSADAVDARDSADAPATLTTGWGPDSTGFGSSRPQPANSVFEEARQAARAARQSPTWMTPGRWLGSDS